MINTFTDFFQFIWKPKLEKDPNNDPFHIIKVFTILLLFSFSVAFFLLIIIGMLTTMGIINQGEHVFDDLFEKNSVFEVFLFASIIAPVIEELIFRGPLIFFKNSKFFKFAFYGFTLLFGYVHIFNFEISTNVLLFSPILVAPQIYLGLVLGYMRVRFGLIWAMLMHAVYNGILVAISLFAINALK